MDVSLFQDGLVQISGLHVDVRRGCTTLVYRDFSFLTVLLFWIENRALSFRFRGEDCSTKLEGATLKDNSNIFLYFVFTPPFIGSGSPRLSRTRR